VARSKIEAKGNVPGRGDIAEHAAYVRKSMRIIHDPIIEQPTESGVVWDEDWFFELLNQEAQNIDHMRPGGYQEKVWLLLDIKLNILQPADETYDTQHLDNLQHHHKIDAQREDMFQHLGGKDPLSEEEYHVDAAKACRDVRFRMNNNACGADTNRTCVFNVLLPTLDLLQRRAYEEIRRNVNIAVGHRLPAELTFLVFEHTMVAEQVPLDPRITLEAKHQAEGPTARKTRLLCDHPGQASPMSGSGYVHGDE
jgi:hypothetical protein